MKKYFIYVNHLKDIQILSKIYPDREKAEKKLKKIQRMKPTMFCIYSNAKLGEIVDVM